MEKSILTQTEKQLIENYHTLCRGLTAFLGEGYEVVLYQLENSGYIAQQDGDKDISSLNKLIPKPILEKFYLQTEDAITFFAQDSRGEPVKSSAICIRGENHQIIGFLCLNFYLSTSSWSIMKGFISDMPVQPAYPSESVVTDVAQVLTQAISEIRPEVIADTTVSASNKNKEIIARLSAMGIFNLKDSVIQCAKIMGISKNTVYMHIRNMK